LRLLFEWRRSNSTGLASVCTDQDFLIGETGLLFGIAF
jgi:hypothetical protein